MRYGLSLLFTVSLASGCSLVARSPALSDPLHERLAKADTSTIEDANVVGIPARRELVGRPMGVLLTARAFLRRRPRYRFLLARRPSCWIRVRIHVQGGARPTGGTRPSRHIPHRYRRVHCVRSAKRVRASRRYGHQRTRRGQRPSSRRGAPVSRRSLSAPPGYRPPSNDYGASTSRWSCFPPASPPSTAAKAPPPPAPPLRPTAPVVLMRKWRRPAS